MIFPVVMYRCESSTIKKANTSELVLLNCGAGEDSMESPMDYKEIKPVNPKYSVSPEYSLEGLMLKLKHQYLVI